MASFTDTSFVYTQRNVIVIQTGDKEYFTVKYRGSTKEMKFNTEGFNFVGIDGTFVAREQAEGNQYPLEFYFDGENYIDDVRKFELSARNKNSWTVTHPIYGSIICQPLTISYDDSFLNMTRVSCTVWESITQKYPLEKTDVKSNIYEIKPYLYVEDSFTNKLSQKSIASAKKLTDLINIDYSKLPMTSSQLDDFKSKLREVDSFAQELISQPIRYIESLQALIEFPFIIEDDIVNKIKKLKSTFLNFCLIKDNSLQEVVSAAYLYSAINMSINSKFKKRSDVVSVSNDITEIDFTSKNILEEELIQQNPIIAQKNDYIVNYGLSNLYEIGMDSKQERNIILEYDSNVVSLTNRFYGFSDENMDKFINENNITIDELIEVKKGRKILWYI